MRKRLILACLAPLLLGQQCLSPTDLTGSDSSTTVTPPAYVESPRVQIETSQGTIVLELFSVQAPETTKAFLRAVGEQYFDDTIIHSANSSEGIRGGLYQTGLTAKSASDTIPNESSNRLSNRRRYVALTESGSDGSASLEFVIYTADSTTYDFVPGSPSTTGRTVFGRVVEGMGVVDAIAAVDTQSSKAQDGTTLSQTPVDSIGVTITQTSGEVPAPSEEPSIVCPAAVEAETTGDLTTVAIGEATATDATDNALTPTNDAPANGYPMGTTTVTWTATDAEGRVATCTQTVTVTGALTSTATGLQYKDYIVGTGAQPADENATVTVNYVGTLEDGTQFDAGNGASFSLSQVIPGFSEGVLSMRVGGKRKLIIPPDLGYGDQATSSIPANSTLIFMVELVSIDG